jgi:hypothetical protein
MSIPSNYHIERGSIAATDVAQQIIDPSKGIIQVVAIKNLSTTKNLYLGKANATTTLSSWVISPGEIFFVNAVMAPGMSYVVGDIGQAYCYYVITS